MTKKRIAKFDDSCSIVIIAALSGFLAVACDISEAELGQLESGSSNATHTIRLQAGWHGTQPPGQGRVVQDLVDEIDEHCPKTRGAFLYFRKPGTKTNPNNKLRVGYNVEMNYLLNPRLEYRFFISKACEVPENSILLRPRRPDLVVSRFSRDIDYFYAQICNQGNGTARNFAVTWVNPDGTIVVFPEWRETIDVERDRTITHPRRPAKVTTKSYLAADDCFWIHEEFHGIDCTDPKTVYVDVDYQDSVTERNENNNIVPSRLSGLDIGECYSL